jgi:hypothetical protein
MHWIREHAGGWISVRARAERTPPRLAVTLTFGQLPDGWHPPHGRAQTWIGIVGLVCIAPFIALLIASLLRIAGIAAPYAWISDSSVAILAGTMSLFVGIPVAIVINLWRIARVGVHRASGALDGLVALEFAPLHLLVVMAALVVGGLFVGHLAADAYACWNGVRSAC